jgi:hypothetical protein
MVPMRKFSQATEDEGLSEPPSPGPSPASGEGLMDKDISIGEFPKCTEADFRIDIQPFCSSVGEQHGEGRTIPIKPHDPTLKIRDTWRTCALLSLAPFRAW